MDYPDVHNPILQNIVIFFLTGFSYQLIGRAGPIRRKIVCKMMGRTEESFDRIVYKDATWRSWVNEDKCMLGRHRNFELFKRTDMHVWHGVKSSTERKLAKHIKEWQENGYAFTYKVFSNLGHGTLAGERPEQFSQEVQAAHRHSLEVMQKGQ